MKLPTQSAQCRLMAAGCRGCGQLLGVRGGQGSGVLGEGKPTTYRPRLSEKLMPSLIFPPTTESSRAPVTVPRAWPWHCGDSPRLGGHPKLSAANPTSGPRPALHLSPGCTWNTRPAPVPPGLLSWAPEISDGKQMCLRTGFQDAWVTGLLQAFFQLGEPHGLWGLLGVVIRD